MVISLKYIYSILYVLLSIFKWFWNIRLLSLKHISLPPTPPPISYNDFLIKAFLALILHVLVQFQYNMEPPSGSNIYHFCTDTGNYKVKGRWVCSLQQFLFYLHNRHLLPLTTKEGGKDIIYEEKLFCLQFFL